MNNKLFFIIAVLSMILISSCAMHGVHPEPPAQTEPPVPTALPTYVPEQSTANGDLAEYTGIWYGFGTDGTEAVTSATVLDFTGDNKFILGSETYTLVDKYTAESDSTSQDSAGNICKVLVQFGKDSNGELALNMYGIRQSDRKQYTEAMCFYRQSSRTNIQDFVPNTEQGSNPTAPTTTDAETKKTEFTKRAQEIEEYDRTYLQNATTQAMMNKESKNVFDQWDILLNDVYQYLKTIKSTSEFDKIESDEINWIKEKETAINNAAIDYKGGSMEAMVRNTTAANYTRDRCYYLISLIQ